MPLFIDVHILQTVPPSNLNRDDTGSPKSAYYGGVRRARVSSQAWKRATRTAFSSLISPAQLGVRTKRVVDLVAERMKAIAPELTDDVRARAATEAVEATGVKVKAPDRPRDAAKDAAPGNPQSGYLLFLSRSQVDKLAALAIEAAASGMAIDKKVARAAADSSHSVDVALFGRMVADAADINVDAAAQVAHAISVHAVENEFDYFTAVDDRSPDDNAGAGMIGTIEFNSSTLYRYATVNVEQLRKNLTGTDGDQDATAAAVEAFLHAFVTSMPTGKQNTFANRTVPDAVVVQLRDRQPINLVGAFEEAVVATGGGSRLRAAAESLVRYSRGVEAAYPGAPLASWVVRVGAATEPLASLGESVSLDELVTRVGEHVRAGRVPTVAGS